MTLVQEDGTQLSKSAAEALTEDVVEADPRLTVTEDIYRLVVPHGTDFPAVQRMLQWHAGQIIRQSEFDAAFPTATIRSISPATGSTAGGTAVTIKGWDFTPGSTVTFGGAAATSIVVVDEEKITCVTPAGSAGAADVVVTTDAGAVTEDDAFTYVAPALPTITSITPATGPAAGGTAVTIEGTNFLTGATVEFGETEAVDVEVVSSTEITCTTPAGEAGAVDVVVTTTNGSATETDGFTYS